MLFFYYGRAEFYVNVTNAVYTKCVQGDTIHLPAGDLARASMFADFYPAVMKHMLITDARGLSMQLHPSASATVPRDAVSVSQIIVDDPSEKRKLWWNTVGSQLFNVDDQLAGLHERTIIHFGDKRDELPEQLLSLQFIKPHDTVLEIGGNIGRNSCVIATILNDDTRLVVLESSPRFAHQLAMNKYQNNMNFHVEASALSSVPLVQNGWTTTEGGSGGECVNTITLDQLRARYPLRFNVLVADCEGALANILRDYPNLLDNIRLVLLENDFPTIQAKQFVDGIMTQAGLRCTYARPGPPSIPFASKDNFYEVWELA